MTNALSRKQSGTDSRQTPLPGASRPRVPTSRRGIAKRAQLLASAEECFGRLGYAGASVAEIVRVADVSQGGFYVYFVSKEAIFRELVLDIAHQIRVVTKAAIAGTSTAQEAEIAGTQAFLRWLIEHRHLHRVLHQIDEVDEQLAREFYGSVSEPYTARLAEGMKAGTVGELNPELLAFALMGVNHFVSMRWVLWTGEEFPPALVKDMNRLLLRMLGPDSPEPSLDGRRPKRANSTVSRKA